ncbi:MAG: subclass B3 metallo-beta-lactamase, partial [Gammaproteobacteria bacterium]|nr:subclass B3 metallo-beta-lactamase [Gammaproteobacteria bacterium]
MNKPFLRIFLAAGIALLASNLSWAQPEGWIRPYPGFQVIGNLYGVGTYDLSVFLIATDEGHILI